jgi:hypothetical protein
MLKTSRSVQYDRACICFRDLAVLCPPVRVEITTLMNESQSSSRKGQNDGHRRAHVERDDTAGVRRPLFALLPQPQPPQPRPIRESTSLVPAETH